MVLLSWTCALHFERCIVIISYSMVVHHHGDGVFHLFLMLKDQSSWETWWKTPSPWWKTPSPCFSRFSRYCFYVTFFSLEFPASLRGFMGLTGRSEETSDAWNRPSFGEQDDDFGVLNWWFQEATKFWPEKKQKKREGQWGCSQAIIQVGVESWDFLDGSGHTWVITNAAFSKWTVAANLSVG